MEFVGKRRGEVRVGPVVLYELDLRNDNDDAVFKL